jgi:disulfide bond formation protein DsbB
MSLTSFIISASALGTLVSHVLIVIVLVGLVLCLKIIDKTLSKLAPFTFYFAFAVALLGVVGSLLFSEFIGFTPCVLCWIQRIFLYPLVIILPIAMIRRDKGIAPYILGLSIPGAIVALYQSYTQLGGYSVTPCTASGGSCSKVYVLEYGYITIPLMAFTAFLWIIISMIIHKRYAGK